MSGRRGASAARGSAVPWPRGSGRRPARPAGAAGAAALALPLRRGSGRLLCDPPPARTLLPRAARKPERSRRRAAPGKPAASAPPPRPRVSAGAAPGPPPSGVRAAARPAAALSRGSRLACRWWSPQLFPGAAVGAPGSRTRGLPAGSPGAGRALTRLI